VAFLRIAEKDNRYIDVELPAGRTSIGRDSKNDIIIADTSVSKNHARLNFENSYFLTDLRSTNGTYINGEKILHTRLIDGDQINFAGIYATFYE
jgi:pSer/pThr/pTyr-binding forkhead associated (FHA) protein